MINKNTHKINNKSIQGFTMVELVVALSIFAVIMTISSSILINSIRMTRIVAHQARAMDNVSLSVEQMAREVRMGSNIRTHSVNNVITEGLNNSFYFRSYAGNTVSYSICGTRMCRNNMPITDESIILTGGFFMQTFSNRVTPRITVALRVTDRGGNLFGLIQTTISARLIHYKL